MINDTDDKIVLDRITDGKKTWVFFYAPLCGTCDLARSFINMAEVSAGESFIYNKDLNYFKSKTASWEIESVPCLVLFENGMPVKKLYAFESVTKVYDFINSGPQ